MKELVRLTIEFDNHVVVRITDGGLRFGDDLNDKYADFKIDDAQAARLRDALSAYLNRRMP